MDEQVVLVERPADGVGLVRLNRPRALNALNGPLMYALMDALDAMDRDPAIRCMVITGSDRAFAAGADISEMAQATPAEMVEMAFIARWERLRAIRKPVIAAVSGFALGGGCELALACDLIVASDTAVFGQPEINLGVIPGAGGTQRLARTIGKALTMEMVLNDRRLTAAEAERFGLVNRVVPLADYLDTAITMAAQIAARAPVAAQAAKDAVNVALETSLTAGLAYERNQFYALFSTQDQKEGMTAFLEKRSPTWKGK
ncbi:MAG TPA: enoyl-CoA hydratase-related protein [Aggregatilinea sp.]|uniref:enoyl-CoA hydratase-related protein n=1 Tax=Aggregatilinea sp. TaxID=2806333 RepID=UPI002CE8209F|nr:enoyl-CoA hydratase-related protein [Aggregatilinea sp.]HML20818.1 enoyl-CoA hydratase-related protein [Aggregatilinea sp.]